MEGGNMEKIQNQSMNRVLSEMKEILKYITKDMYNKIPDDIKNIINSYSSEDYEFKYDCSKDLKEQQISEDTKKFIGYLHYNYWADSESKKRIEDAWKKNEEKYNNIFEKNSEIDKVELKNNEKSDIQEELSLVEKKESFFKRILNKIKSLFN